MRVLRRGRGAATSALQNTKGRVLDAGSCRVHAHTAMTTEAQPALEYLMGASKETSGHGSD